MKLLFDQNLSRRLSDQLADLYPDSTQAIAAGLDKASDREVRSYAEKNGYIIVTRDRDFVGFDVLYGAPPKTILRVRISPHEITSKYFGLCMNRSRHLPPTRTELYLSSINDLTN